MKRNIFKTTWPTRCAAVIVAIVMLGSAFGAVTVNPAYAAACAAPATDYGSATADVSIPATATYRIWSRIMAPDTVNNSYLLEIDGANCYTVGGGALSPNVWVWVNYQNGVASSPIDLSLNQGTHKIKVIGKQAGVKFDRVVFTSDTACTPTGNGDNCNTPADTVLPTVNLTAPADNASLRGKVSVSADATDNTGIREVKFYANSTLIASDTSAPYSAEWDTSAFANGHATVIARAYDTAGNSNSSSHEVTVQNTVSDTQAPSQPTGVTATALAYDKTEVIWQSSTDNTGVAGYRLTRDGAPLVELAATARSYQDTGLLPSTTYKYKVTAFDAAGNVSPASQEVSVATAAMTDTQPPTTPTNVTATAVSSKQINVGWKASTDNIGVKEYDVYRSAKGGTATKVATVRTTNLGDTDLQASTEYTYTIKAKDAAGNTSQSSTGATAKTTGKVRTSVVYGDVQGTRGAHLNGASITIAVQNAKYTATTNKQGRYIIRDIPRGKYTFSYSAAGYQTKSFSRNVSNAYVWQEVTLRKK